MPGMRETTLSLTSSDGIEVFIYRWTPSTAPRAVIVIAHGLGEHAARYRRFAITLTALGYLAYAPDHRGHGRTAGGPHAYGDLGEGGWQGLVDDLHSVVAMARANHPDLKVLLFGHSLGSMATQQFLFDHSHDVDAVVLSGTTAADVLTAQLDPNAEADLSAFNAPFEHRTGFEWLSRDEAEVDAYVADRACGFGLKPSSMPGWVSAMSSTGDPQRLAGIRPDLPILLVSGGDDPLAAGGDLIELVASRYREAGVRDVRVTIHPRARHEILNEINRAEIIADILSFVDETVGG